MLEGRRFLAFAVAASLAAAPGVAHAFSTSRLEYDLGPGAETCPAEPEVRANVVERLGYDPFVESAARTIVVRIARIDENLKATVELVDAVGSRRGRREFSAGADRCGELVSALALSISIAVDPERAQAAIDRELPATPPPTEAREPRPETRAPSRRDTDAPIDTGVDAVVPQPEKRALRWQLGAGGHAALGIAPAPTGGTFVFVGAALASASLSLEGRADLPASTRLETGAKVGTSLLLASAVPCWEHPRLFACALLSTGIVRASGAQIIHPGDDSGFYAAAGLRLGTTVALYDHLALRVNLDVLDALTPVSLQIDDQNVWEAPSISGAAGVGLLAHFP